MTEWWNNLKAWLSIFWAHADAVPIRIKIMGMVAGTAFLVGGWSIFQVNEVMKQEAERQCHDMSIALASELAVRAQEYVLLNDLLGLTQLLKNAVKNLPDLRYAFVLDNHGEVIAHSFEGGFPLDLLKVEHGISPAVESLAIKTNEGQVWDAVIPILKGEGGLLRAGVSERRSETARLSLLNALMLTTIVVAGLGILFSGLLTWLLTRPLKELVNFTRMLKTRDFSARVTRITDDEIGQLAAAFNEMAAQLEMAERVRQDADAMRSGFLQKVILAQEEERKRIACELHDQTAQSLAFLMLELRILEQAQDQAAINASIGRLRQALTQELNSIRNMAMELRPLVLDDMGVSAAIESYVRRFEEGYGMKIDLYLDGFDGIHLPFYVEIALYRIVQEAMLNVVRHAAASNVTVIIERIENEIRGVVEDNGRGFDVSSLAATHRFGIYGMKERAQLLGGSLSVESEPGQGTMVSFVIPIRQVFAEDARLP
ncbi:MAG: ATP-binding protein [Deltaproteobacteria bacterium]|jgi:signal transduction histidine kinase|nr:ATP-binding protein [Deltaproteobacteria bacterium]